MKYIVFSITAVMMFALLCGCVEKKFKNENLDQEIDRVAELENEQAEDSFSDQSSQIKIAQENGIVVLTNAKKIKNYNDNNGLFVCNYVINEHFYSVQEINNFVLNIMKQLYSQDGWALQPEAITDNTITLIGSKPGKELFVVLIIRKNKNKKEVLVHATINQDLS